MQALKDALIETFDMENIWQCEYMPLVDRIQIVIKLKAHRVMGKDYNSRLDVLNATRIILMLARFLDLKHDLRLAFKLQSDLTVATMIFSRDAISGYSEGYDFEAIAQEFHIVSGLK